MKLRRLQVKNFRCVEDSTEFSICPVTCLVGKNGAGKTSLLEALYKLNPDVEELANFDVLMEYPRARRRQYQKNEGGEPDDALVATWELDDADVARLENVLGPGSVKSRTVVTKKGYYDGRKWAGVIGAQAGPAIPAPEPNPAETSGQLYIEPSRAEETPGQMYSTTTGEVQDTQPPSAPADEPTQSPPAAPATSDSDLLERHVGKLLPKLLYFSEWHMMEGRISIDALLQRRQKGELTGPDRVFLALLELGGTSVEALTSIERSEELIADLEDAARPVTDEIGAYWSQERDLRVSFHLYPGRTGDPSPFDRGLVFETRIVNMRTNLSLNFEERSTGFVWFFSFLVWYSEVRKRNGENLLILLDDPGLGLHAKAQWDLLRYVYEKLANQYQLIYSTHSPFMIDPEQMPWVRTVEEIIEHTSDGRLNYLGTKVGDEILSTDHDTLLPLQASLGYRIMRDLAGSKRLLLVEKPAEVFYLEWFSARLHEQGRSGLHPAWTVVPCGDLVRLATLAGLLANEASGFAVLLGLAKEHPDVTRHRELARMLEKCHVFPLSRYAKPSESTIEDLLGPQMYLSLVDLAYKIPRKQRLARTVQAVPGMPLLGFVREAFAANRPAEGKFDRTIPAEFLFKSGDRRLAKLPGLEEAMGKFEALCGALNACL